MAFGKRTSARIKNARSVSVAAETHGAGMAAELDRVLGMPAGSMLALFTRLAAYLVATTKRVDELELALQREAGDDNAVLAARDEAHAAARTAIGQARALVLAFVGQEARKPFGLDAEIPTTATQMADYARSAADALVRAALSINISDNVAVATETLGKQIAAREVTLTKALKDVETEARELKDAIGARDLGLEPWTRAYRGVALTLSGLFTLAGREDLAGRVRPTERSARGEEEPEADDESPTPAPAPES